MSISAKVTMFKLKLRGLDQAAVTALEKTTEAVHTDIVQAQVIPFDTGHLQNDGTFIDISGASAGHTEIISSTPYARRLYFHPEYNFQRTENPNAKAHWFDDWADGGSKSQFTQDAFAKFFKREAARHGVT